MRHSRSLALATLLAVALPRSGHAQSDTAWQYRSPERLIWHLLDAAGHLVVGGPSGFTALDAEHGTPAWTIPLKEPVLVLRSRPLRLLAGAGRSLVAIDPASGSERWRRSDLPELKHTLVELNLSDSFAVLQSDKDFLLLDLETGATRWNAGMLPPGTTVRDYFWVGSANLLILLVRTPESELTVLGVSADSGTILWRNDALFHAKPQFKRVRKVEYVITHQPRLPDDSTLVLYLSTEGPIALNPRTGELRWRSTALARSPVPSIGDGYAAAEHRGNALIFPSEKHLVALSLATGEKLWATSWEYTDRISWLTTRPDAIIAGAFGRSGAYVALLDTLGGRRGPVQLNLEASATGIVVQDTLFLSNGGVLQAWPFATGVPQKIADIGFESGEQPLALDTLAEGGLVLMGRQNLARIGTDGTVYYRRHYRAPGTGFWELMGGALLGTPIYSHARAARARNFFYIFTAAADSTGQKGFSLVRLDRRDGKDIGRLWFAQRNPRYRIDGASGVVYQFEGDDLVLARRFPRTAADSEPEVSADAKAP